MIKKAVLEFDKIELGVLLKGISKDKNKDLYEKLRKEYLLICHQEAVLDMISKYYGHNFISAKYHHSDSNYKEGLLKFSVSYSSINQETYNSEVVCDVEMAKIINNNDFYSYELLFHN